MNADWMDDLEHWLQPFLAGLSHRARRRMCPLYIAGLIGPGDRKSVQPMAARADDVGYDQLHHFVATEVWDSSPLAAALLKEAYRLVGDQAGFFVIDDTEYRRRDNIQLLSRLNTLRPLVRHPIASHWCLSPWPRAKCR